MHLREQPRFLNACCIGKTKLSPEQLLCALQAIERRAGRRKGVHFGPRELDLDLLLYGERVVRRPGLEVPHPRMVRRPFVLWPLAEIAGEWVVPGANRAVAPMAAELSRSGVRSYAPAAFFDDAPPVDGPEVVEPAAPAAPVAD